MLEGVRVRVRLLGPVDAVVDGVVRPVEGARRKALLAMLALRAGEVVSADLITDVLWADAPPATAANTVQSHVSHLRRVLGSRTVVRARSPGYLLDAGNEPTDLVVVERLVREGTRSRDPVEGARLLQAAVDLWRGPPLMDVVPSPWFDEQIRRLDALRLQARESLVDQRLAGGAHRQLVGELERLCGEHPLHERVHGQLMLALYRSGRQADALAVYRGLRRTLDEELGIEPGHELVQLETAILRQDESLDLPPAVSSMPPAVPPTPAMVPDPTPRSVPAQLPLGVRAFAGRNAELAELTALLRDSEESGQGSEVPEVVICAISGAPGTGKTSLAVHWAHQMVGQYPDGQLYVNLRGFDPDAPAVDPADVIARFLVAFGVPAASVPPGLEAGAALFRSVVAGRRVLVVLDNARDSEHVRHLLPGAPGCLVLVTSRDQLSGLVVTEGAHVVVLGPLGPAGARELLTRRLGRRRVEGASAALDAMTEHCARLPLALAVAAARAATRPDVPLQVLATEMAAMPGRLDAFTGGDAATDVRRVFDWSYRALTPPAARLFRLLGLSPGPDVALHPAACLAGVSAESATRLLAELGAASLLLERAPGRHTLHDLLRAYARELALCCDGEQDRRDALQRLLEHYLHSAHAAVLLLDPARAALPLPPASNGVVVAGHSDHDRALGWFGQELEALVAAVRMSADLRLDDYTWRLAWCLTTYLDWVGNTRDLVGTQELALIALERLGRPDAQAHAHRDIGRTLARTGDHDRAGWHLERARRLYEELGDAAGQARAHHSIGWLLQIQGRFREALAHTQEELRLSEAAGDRVWQARALDANGWLHAKLGEHQQALDFCERALPVMQELGDRHGEGGTWDTLGLAYLHLADLSKAVTSFERAADLFRQVGDRPSEADVLLRLGDAHRTGGNIDLAQGAWRNAVAILEQLDLPADHVRSRLDGLPSRASGSER